ncbi:two-component regulator propeller domain-containing protein [Flammeovirga sp. SubArs3]|uniref:ligand-binding sensor domain-containing protein n=1 Tax=Flammeovirga sp. SubArs3 TaxID=2995316 RepID=UPI00248C06AC|nr:two-component regulator propeller domain-containing protein [Flammeovirga sp. SubArs3]
MNRFLQQIINIFLFALSISFTYSQSLDFIYYPVDAGLISGQLKSITHTSDGIIWGATDNGILRFDGKKVDLINHTLPSHYIKSFTHLKDGRVLIVHDLGIGILSSNYDEYSIESFIDGSTNRSDQTKIHYPKSIYVQNDSTFWIGEDSSIVYYQLGQPIKRYTLHFKSQSPHYVRTVLFEIDGFNNPWVFSYNVGIFKYDNQKDIFTKVSLPQKLSNISWVEKVSFKTFWVGGEEGVFEMEVDRQGNIVNWTQVTTIEGVSSGKKIGDYQMIIGTWSDGAYFIDFSNSTRIQHPIDLQGVKDILSLDYQKELGWWIGGTESIGLLKKVPFQWVDLVSNHVLIEAAKETRKGNVIISEGDSLRQLEWLENRWKQTFVYHFKERVRSFIEYNGKVYIGTYEGQLFSTSYNQNLFTKVEGIKMKGAVVSFFIDEENHLWCSGEYQNGVFKVDQNDNAQHIQGDALNGVQVIKGINNGTFYLGGDKRHCLLQKYNYTNQKFEKVNAVFPREVEENIVVWDLLIKKDVIYLATSDGCFYFSSKSTQEKILLSELLPVGLDANTSFKAIEMTDDGALWLASFKGLYRVKNDEAQLFDKTNGLPSNAIKIQGLSKDSDGRLWIATEKGLVVATESRDLDKKTKAPEISMVILNADGSETLVSDSTEKIPYQSDVELKFNTQKFPTSNISYQYRMLSSDTVWVNLDKVDQLSFLNLMNGSYTLEVRATLKGYQSSDISTMKFEVKTPFYKAPAFYVILVLLLAVLIFFIFRQHNKNLIEKGKRLEHLVEIRAKEITSQKTKIMEQQQEIYQKKQKIIEAEKSIAEADLKNAQLREEKLQEMLEQKNKHLTVVTLNIVEKNNFMHTLKKQLKDIEGQYPDVASPMKHLYRTIEKSDKTDKDWEEFQHYFEGVHQNFNQHLKEKHPSLTAHDLRHCALIRLNLSLIECANLLGISQDSIKTSRYRLKKKLTLSAEENLQDYILAFK